MPNVDLTEMDLAVIECLHSMSSSRKETVQPSQLIQCVEQRFPGYDEVAMREGESITRLRGRQLLDLALDGGLSLTSLGVELAEGLQLERDQT